MGWGSVRRASSWEVAGVLRLEKGEREWLSWRGLSVCVENQRRLLNSSRFESARFDV